MKPSLVSFLWSTARHVSKCDIHTLVQKRRYSQLTLSGCPESTARHLKQKLDIIVYEFLGSLQGRIHLHFSNFKEHANPSESELACLLSILAASQDIGPSHILALGEIGIDGRITLSHQTQRNLAEHQSTVTDLLGTDTILSPQPLPYARHIDLNQISPDLVSLHLLPLLKHCSESLPVESIPAPVARGQKWFESLDPNMQRLASLLLTGWHSALLVGSPGIGKSYFARGLSDMLFDLQRLEHKHDRIPSSVPLIQPHSQATAEQLVFGYRTKNVAGCWDESRGGVLWIDEIAEFKRHSLEALRVPLDTFGNEQKRIVIATANPCPCGHWRHDTHTCHCGPNVRSRYWQHISGPLVDRISVGISPGIEASSSLIQLENSYSAQCHLILDARKRLATLHPEFSVGTQWVAPLQLENTLRLQFGSYDWRRAIPHVSRRRLQHIQRRILTVWALNPDQSLNNLMEESFIWDCQNSLHRWWDTGPALYAPKKTLEEVSLVRDAATQSFGKSGGVGGPTTSELLPSILITTP